jgi:hypothetical protein
MSRSIQPRAISSTSTFRRRPECLPRIGQRRLGKANHPPARPRMQKQEAMGHGLGHCSRVVAVALLIALARTGPPPCVPTALVQGGRRAGRHGTQQANPRRRQQPPARRRWVHSPGCTLHARAPSLLLQFPPSIPRCPPPRPRRQLSPARHLPPTPTAAHPTPTP